MLAWVVEDAESGGAAAWKASCGATREGAESGECVVEEVEEGEAVV